MEFLDIIHKRRSIRNFTDKKILEENIKMLKRYIDRCNFVFNKK